MRGSPHLLARAICPSPLADSLGTRLKNSCLSSIQIPSSCGRFWATASFGRQPREAQELARVQHSPTRPIPLLQHATPPFSDRRGGSWQRALQNPLFSKRRDRKHNQDLGLSDNRFVGPAQLLSWEAPCREHRPTPTPAELPGNGQLSRAEGSLKNRCFGRVASITSPHFLSTC